MIRNSGLALSDELRDAVDDDLKDAVIVGEDLGLYSDRKVHGPPGTGKSTQKDLIKAEMILDGVPPRKILDATYRRSQAADVIDRLVEWGLVDEGDLDADMWEYTGTLHSVEVAITGILSDDSVDVADDDVKEDFTHDILQRRYWTPDSEPDPAGRLALQCVEWFRNNLIDPLEAPEYTLQECPYYDDLTDQWPSVDIAEVTRTWEAYKDERGVVDFWEMLAAGASVGLPNSVDVVMLDEYHDVTPLMDLAARKLIEDADTAAIVLGDHDQVVNSYAGASPEFFRRLDLPEVQLKETHRVPETSWRAATYMLDKAPDHSAPPVSRSSFGTIVERSFPMVGQYEDGTWDVPGVGTPHSPAWLIERHGTDSMFLTRTQAQAKAIAQAIEEHGVTYKAQDDVGGWQRDGIRATHNALVLLSDYSRADVTDTDGNASLTGSSGRSSKDVLTPLQTSQILRHSPAGLWDDDRESLDARARLALAQDEGMRIDELADRVKSEFFDRMTQGAGSVSQLSKRGALSSRDLVALRRLLSKRGERHLDVSDIELQCLTIHASKGAEASSVFLLDGVTSKIKESLDTREGRNNEMRTWFVALSRSSDMTMVLRGWDEHVSWISSFLPPELVPAAQIPESERSGDAVDAAGD